jgi:hypothetical protein
LFWQEHFSFYPFTFDREDARFAKLIAWMVNISGRTAKKPFKETDFLPDYLGEKRAPARKEKTLEQQRSDFLAFKAKLKAVRPDWVKEK